MAKKWIFWLIFIIIVVFIAFVIWGYVASDVEKPQYKVLSSHEQIEVRQYQPMIVAEVETTGQRQEAIKKGFRLLANYIFGNNSNKVKLAMTAPVLQQGQKIPETTPVTQTQTDNHWTIRFVMPSKYTLATLPKPNNSKVTLKPIPLKTYAVIRFSGMLTKNNLAAHYEKLKSYLSEHDIKPLSPPIYAFYNPPWTLPFLRRNEIMFEIKN